MSRRHSCKGPTPFSQKALERNGVSAMPEKRIGSWMYSGLIAASSPAVAQRDP